MVEYRLPNGMRWFFVRQGQAPVFTGVVMVKVGGMEEQPGKTGLAHMFEHMAFKGTREIGTTDFAKESMLMDRIRRLEAVLAQQAGDAAVATRTEIAALSKGARQYSIPNEIWHLFHKNGAEEVNAFTGKDLTGYYAKLPANMLPLWAFLTSEMVGFPVLREFHQERDVVMEERRSSVDASPRGTLYEAMLAQAFSDSPYRWMTIGSMTDLQSLALADAEAFHATYYRPDRMVGAIVGVIDIGEAKRAVTRFFGRLPAKRSPPLYEKKMVPTAVSTPPPRAPLRVRFDAEPLLMMGYPKPPLPHWDDYVFDILATVLCDGMTSRLERRLVQVERMARSVDCASSTPGARLPNLFTIEAEPIAPHTPQAIAAVVEEELKRLRTEPIDDTEFAKARANIEADFLWGIATNEGLAQQLAYFAAVAGDWRYITRHGNVMQGITAAEVTRVAQRYLTPDKAIVAELVKK